MQKRLLSFFAIAAMAVTANAVDLPLTSEDTSDNAPLYSGWDSSYDQTTQTITYEGAWTGRGWWLAEDDIPADLSMYTHLVITMEANIGGQVVVQYKVGDGDTNEKFPFNAGATSVKCLINQELAVATLQIYLQCSSLTANPTIKLIKAELQDNSDNPDTAIWEGEYVSADWSAGVDINQSLLKVGDIITLTATPGDDDNAMMLVKNADWGELLGSSKITNSSIVDGKIDMYVTQEMVVSCGGKIFLQGAGGITVTRAEISGKYEVEEGLTILNGGQRGLPAEIFATIPEGAKSLWVLFDTQPEWLQVCDNTWAPLIEINCAQVEESEQGCMLSLNLTDEVIAALNANNQIILNGGGANYIASYVSDKANGLTAIESAADAAPVYYNLQGMPIANPVSGNLYIVRQGARSTKQVLR